MRKKIIFIGIALFVATLIVGALLFYEIQNIANPFTYYTQTIFGTDFISMNFTFSNSSPAIFMFVAKFSPSVNFYIFNSSTAFKEWSRQFYLNPTNGIEIAKRLEGKGVIAILANASVVAMPNQQNMTSATYIYSSNLSRNYSGPLHEIVVMQSISPNKTNVSIVYIPPILGSNLSSYPNVANYFYYSGILGIVVFSLIIISIGMIIYGLLKKSKAINQENDALIKERDALYGNTGVTKGKNALVKNSKKTRRKQHGS
ncbi:MAG: hypothetical protein QW045_00375 [Candidatus Micrarchaeaceae archaeon]